MAFLTLETIATQDTIDSAPLRSNFDDIVNLLNGTTALNVSINGTLDAVTYTQSGQSLATYATGDIKMSVVTTAPSGWLICNGQAVSRATYSALYSAIGTAYGYGNNSTTFNVPDLRGMFIRGYVGFSDTTFNNSVNQTDDVITTPSPHSINRNGFEARFTNSGGALPAGLSTGVTYFIRVLSTTTFSVFDTYAHAIDVASETGRINLTGDGTGTNKIVQWVDPSESTRTALTTGGNTGSSIGSIEFDSTAANGLSVGITDPGHSHTQSNRGGGGSTPSNYYAQGIDQQVSSTSLTTASATTGITASASSTDVETRPNNITVQYLIKT